MAIIATGWTVLGIFPILPRYPFIGSALAILVGLTTWYEASRPAGADGLERRFEAAALKSATPYIVVYFLVMTLLPLASGFAHFRFELGFTGSGNDLTQQQLRLLEPIAAMTVLGYLIAEGRGRTESSFRLIARRVAVECGIVAGLIEISRGIQRGVGASGMQLVLTIGAGLLGAGIYHHQRAHIRWILTQRSQAAATPATTMAA